MRRVPGGFTVASAIGRGVRASARPKKPPAELRVFNHDALSADLGWKKKRSRMPVSHQSQRSFQARKSQHRRQNHGR